MSKNNAENNAAGHQPVYQTKPLQPHVDDSYRLSGKPPEPALCPECGVVFHEGRWQWLAKPAGAHEVLCPACARMHDGIASGYLKLEGEFLAMHHGEILNLVRHVEKREASEHPLQRIMSIMEAGGEVLITTTDVHLARAVGEAIRHAYQGELVLRYADNENVLRAHWKR